jgi:hypothetical protein
MEKASLKKRVEARKNVERVEKHSKLGSGARFKSIEASAKASGASDPGAVAAAIGRKKYGNKMMSKMAAKGKK